MGPRVRGSPYRNVFVFVWEHIWGPRIANKIAVAKRKLDSRGGGAKIRYDWQLTWSGGREEVGDGAICGRVNVVGLVELTRIHEIFFSCRLSTHRPVKMASDLSVWEIRPSPGIAISLSGHGNLLSSEAPHFKSIIWSCVIEEISNPTQLCGWMVLVV